MLKFIIYISKTKIYQYIFTKNLFNKFILKKRVEEMRFLDLKYKKKNSDFWNKKLEEKYNITIQINLRVEE